MEVVPQLGTRCSRNITPDNTPQTFGVRSSMDVCHAKAAAKALDGTSDVDPNRIACCQVGYAASNFEAFAALAYGVPVDRMDRNQPVLHNCMIGGVHLGCVCVTQRRCHVGG